MDVYHIVGRTLRPLPTVRWLTVHQGRGVGSGISMSSIVQFENVGLRYGLGSETLSDVSFSLHAGGFYFLTG
ncbi:MAG: hypothetical protein WA085_15305, partial [Sphingobium sp.]